MSLQATMRALADPIRREILNLLKGGRLSAGDICAHFDVTGAEGSGSDPGHPGGQIHLL